MGLTLNIRPSTDTRALSAVAQATFLQTFAHMIPAADILARADMQDSPAAFQSALDAGAKAWLATHPETDAPVGFALLTSPDLPEVDTSPGDLELKRIYLLHRFHGTGAGKALLAAVEAEARTRSAPRLLLGVYHDNPAVGWYERQGFSTIGTRSFRVGNSVFHDKIMGKAP